MGQITLCSRVIRKIVLNNRNSGILPGEAVAAMHPDPIYDLVVHVFVFREGFSKAVVRLIGDNQNLVPLLHPLLAHCGDGKAFWVIMRRHDEDLHRAYYLTKRENFSRACIIIPAMETGAVKNERNTLSVRSNVIINLIRTLTMTVLSFITYPYITRALGDQVFGLYSWANAFVYYFLVLAKISIPSLAIRECSKVKDDKEKLSSLAKTFFLIQGITTLFSFGLMCVFVFSVPSLLESKELIFLLSLNFLAGAFSFEWIYIALEKHFYITVRSISFIALGALLTFMFVRRSDTPTFLMNEVYIYALIAISYTLLTSLINCLLLPRYLSIRKAKLCPIKPLIRPLLVLFLISFALTLYNQTDQFLLGLIDTSKASVGSYSVGVKGIDIVITLITSLYAVFLPRASYYYSKENKRFYQILINGSFALTFFIAVPAIATMSTMARPITSLISGSGDVLSGSNMYQDADWILVTLSLMMLTYSIGDNIYNEILLPMKKEKYYLYAMSAGVILNVTLSVLFALVFFKDHPAIGVALATGVSDLLLCAYLIYVSRQYSLKAVFNLNNLKIVLVGILIGVFSYFFCPFLSSLLGNLFEEAWQISLFSLIIVVFIDAVIYLVSLFLLKEQTIRSFFKKKEAEE